MYGLSVSGPRQAETIDRARQIQIGDKRLFDCVQATWNLLETGAGPALQAAHDQGMGVIVKEALANGRLTSRNEDPAFAAQRAILEAESARLGTTLDALALAAVLAQPWVDVVLSGAATVQQVRANSRSLEVGWDRQAGKRLAGLVEDPAAYWDRRSKLAWN